jgi:hypothetical protein
VRLGDILRNRALDGVAGLAPQLRRAVAPAGCQGRLALAALRAGWRRARIVSAGARQHPPLHGICRRVAVARGCTAALARARILGRTRPHASARDDSQCHRESRLYSRYLERGRQLLHRQQQYGDGALRAHRRSRHLRRLHHAALPRAQDRA